MSTNQYLFLTYRIASCLSGGVSYRAASTAEQFEQDLLEERRDRVLQQPGRSYMQVQSCTTGEILWMVPFQGNGDMLDRLLDAMEIALPLGACRPNLHFPIDVAAGGSDYGYLLRPIAKTDTAPLRSFMPDTEAPRWNMAISLFQRVRELHGLGLTSHGLSREQLRADPATGDVHLWLTERLTPADCRLSAKECSHGGFLSLPARTEVFCQKLGIHITGAQRDVFSAAAAAFYLIICEHPFVGAQFAPLPRWMYPEQYHRKPDYVMRPGTENHFGNMSSGLVKRKHWEQTVPELRALFDQLFLAVTFPPEYWQQELDCWDPENWIKALRADRSRNDNELNHTHFNFSRSVYHIV